MFDKLQKSDDSFFCLLAISVRTWRLYFGCTIYKLLYRPFFLCLNVQRGPLLWPFSKSIRKNLRLKFHDSDNWRLYIKRRKREHEIGDDFSVSSPPNNLFFYRRQLVASDLLSNLVQEESYQPVCMSELMMPAWWLLSWTSGCVYIYCASVVWFGLGCAW